MARQAETWTFKHAFVLGMWQALALIPGTSRSGITITGARLLGYKRIDAARLSMLMSIPTTLPRAEWKHWTSLAKNLLCRWVTYYWPYYLPPSLRF